jgi:hypothetical protein
MMRRRRRFDSVFRTLIGCLVASGSVLISGGGRSAIAQTTAMAAATFDPSSTIPVTTTPANPVTQAFSVVSGPSLNYSLARDKTTGIFALATISCSTATDSKDLVFAAPPGFHDRLLVTLKFTYLGAAKKYFVDRPVSVSGGKYTVTKAQLNDLLGRVINQLNATLPQAFKPGDPFSFDNASNVDIELFSIDGEDPGPPAKFNTTKLVDLTIPMTLTLFGGPDEPQPKP